MGMWPKAYFFYGVLFRDELEWYDEYEYEIDRLLEKVKQSTSEPPWEWQVDGVCLEIMYESEEAIGFGTALTPWYSWGENPTFDEVQEQISTRYEKSIDIVQKVLSEYNLDIDKANIYLVVSYS